MGYSKNNINIGELIKQKLLEKELTRQQFCDMYEIPLYRINRLVRGQGIHKVDYARIIRLLQLDEVIAELTAPKYRGKIDRTPLGWEIKRKLAEMKITQKEFCEEHGIPSGRMAEIVTGKRLARNHRKRIVALLGIDEAEFKSEDGRY